MPNSPYIDGSGLTQQRLVKGTGATNSPHIPYTALEDNLVNADRLKIFKPVKNFEGIVAGIANAITFTIDTSEFNYCFIRLENNGNNAWTDCAIDISAKLDSNKWETIANSDYFFTTGQGELEGNSMKLIRKCSPINPRSLAISASSWIILYVPGVPQVRFRITGNSADILYSLSDN